MAKSQFFKKILTRFNNNEIFPNNCAKLWCPQAILDVCDEKSWKINDDELSLKSSVV